MTDRAAEAGAEPPPTHEDAARRRALARYRQGATALLVIAAAVLVATHGAAPDQLWRGLAEAAAEAALVGGLADWFAVTALFRRPLGLPIPHTAVIPQNRDRIAAQFGRFVERHFMEPRQLARWLRRLDPAGRGGAWLAEAANAALAARRIAAVLPAVLDSLDDREIRAFLGRAVEREIGRVDMVALAGRGLVLLRESGGDRELVEAALGAARRWLAANGDRVIEIVGSRSRWWVPRAVDRRVAKAILRGAGELLDELGDPAHEARRHLDSALADAVAALEGSATLRERLERLRGEIAASPAMQEALGQLWEGARQALADQAGRPESGLRAGLAAALQSLGEGIVADPAMRERLNRRLEALVRATLGPWRAEAGRFVGDVMRAWDGRTIAARLELAVGRDLQFIRINGTLVGALIGAMIYLLGRLAG